MTSTDILTAAARIVNGTKTYGDGDAAVTALHEVNVEFGSARFTAIMGPSGSGKSTLMHCIAGLDRLTSGEAFIGDTLLADLKDKKLTELRRSEVGFIFQSFNLVPTLTAEENINLPLSLGGRSGDREWIDTVIDTVGLRDRLSHRPSELSGGQQQRVAVARALASRPTIIFADEPTGNLDSVTGEKVIKSLFQSAADANAALVLVTHDANLAAQCSRVLHIEDGVIVRDSKSPS